MHASGLAGDALADDQGTATGSPLSERILGVWLNEDGDGWIRIVRSGDEYFGVIIGAPAGLRPDALDVNNPDPALRTRPLLDLRLIYGYRFKGKRWVGGRIYDPDLGKEYKSRLQLLDRRTLEVRGYVGAPMFGRTQRWTRVAEPSPSAASQ
ncbi:MAG: DUF2147 domain-containing protein [Pseudomonadota bacterium]